MRLGKNHWLTLAVTLISIVGVIIAFSVLQPTPPRVVIMSTGPSGSAYAEFANQYREFFAANGIDLELLASAGSFENFERLNDPDSGVDVAFVSMAPRIAAANTEVQSLGGVFFQPLWLFTRDLDPLLDPIFALRGKKFSIGPVGSASNAAAKALLQLNKIDTSQFELLDLPSDIAVDMLREGSIAAVLISSASTTEIVTSLLGNKDIVLAGFDRADAYTALYPALTKLVIPEGLGNLSDNIPPEDVTTIAFTAVIGVNKDLHPAIQSLLLDAATQIHGVPDIFHQAGVFPAPSSYAMQLSPVAKRYYESGRPFLQRYLPFWLAVLVMQVIVMAIPLIGIVYPAVRFMPSAFDWAMRRRVFRLYSELRVIEQQTSDHDINDIRDDLLQNLDKLERKARALQLPIKFAQHAYTLRTHINIVRARLQS